MSNYYQVLGLPKYASLEEVKTQYRKLVKLYHPDVNKNPSAKSEFLAIQEAYEALESEELKLAYDRKLKKGNQKKRIYKPSRTARPSIRLKRQLNQIRLDIGNDPSFGHFELAQRLQAIFTADFIHYFAANSTEIEKTEAIVLALEFIHVIRADAAAIDILYNLLPLSKDDSKLREELVQRINQYKYPMFEEEDDDLWSIIPTKYRIYTLLVFFGLFVLIFIIESIFGR